MFEENYRAVVINDDLLELVSRKCSVTYRKALGEYKSEREVIIEQFNADGDIAKRDEALRYVDSRFTDFENNDVGFKTSIDIRRALTKLDEAIKVLREATDGQGVMVTRVFPTFPV